MKNEQLMKRFHEFGDEYDRALYTEYLCFCNCTEEKDFVNYTRPKELTEKEFFSVMNALFCNKCYIMLSKFMKNNRERLIQPDISRIEKLELREDLEERFKRLYM